MIVSVKSFSFPIFAASLTLLAPSGVAAQVRPEVEACRAAAEAAIGRRSEAARR